MAQSLILKKDDGAIAGYVLVSGGKVQYMCRGNGERGKLTILYEEGAQQEVAVFCDAHERQCMALREILIGAYVLVDAKAYASSSPWAAEQAEKRRIVDPKEEKGEEECKKGWDQSVLIEEKEVPCKSTARERQMRWPPPPCWPSACYVDGAWVEAQ